MSVDSFQRDIAPTRAVYDWSGLNLRVIWRPFHVVYCLDLLPCGRPCRGIWRHARTVSRTHPAPAARSSRKTSLRLCGDQRHRSHKQSSRLPIQPIYAIFRSSSMWVPAC